MTLAVLPKAAASVTDIPALPPIRLLTFTTLFPNSEQPNHGVFVENRLRHLVGTGAATSTVLAPVPFFPSRSAMFGTWGRHARVPAHEMRHGLSVHHPRYPVIPRIGMSVAPALLFQTAARALRRMLKDGLNFDIIDAHYAYPDGVAAVWLGRLFAKPVVITLRGSDVTQLPDHAVPRALIRRALAGADGLITVSAGLRQQAVARLGVAPERVRVLRNGVDTTAFRPAERDTARASLGLTRPTLLSVGHLIERKGHHLTIQAMRLLPEFDLMIIGEGPEHARLVSLIAEAGLGPRVRLLGPIAHAQLPVFYTAADAMVLASSREGWANVLLESMACGTPVIASRIPGNPEVVQSAAAGLIVDSNTPEGIAAGVRALFAGLPARTATRAYAEGFGWDATSQGQLRLFRGILS